MSVPVRSRGENFTTEFTNYTAVVPGEVLQKLVLLLLVVLAVLELGHHEVALVVGEEVHAGVGLHGLLELLLLGGLAEHAARRLRGDDDGLLFDGRDDLDGDGRREVRLVLVVLGVVVVFL